ncbi:hypothetical protein glysoja_041844 [Glycine soja]|uniref:Uncharacterized protein n=1 Tax=Glycine soja TaxID=3848 RepID=A0A0B2S0D6_GLYSO|nr:hypothetical protein glysoja_041844 [Glycine soja]
MKRSEEFEFEFPAAVYVSGGVPNDVVFCGKVMTRRTEGETRALLRSETSNRYRRIESCRRRYNGMFGTVMKFPLQMELSDIKMRQERRELPPTMPKVAAKGDGGESCWELVQPLRRRGTLKNALFGCLVPVV